MAVGVAQNESAKRIYQKNMELESENKEIKE
jgi:hypothetical protein